MTAIDFAGPLPSSTVATVSQARGWARGLATSGVYADGVGLYTGGFACTDGGDLDVSVAAGEGLVDGVYARSTGTKTVTLAAADPTNPRIDLIVLRLDPTGSGALTLEAVTGTPAGSPSAPAPTQSASGVWEVPLASVLVPAGSAVLSTITDLRVQVNRGNSILALDDTPTSMSGKAGQTLMVNPGETGLEFGPAGAQTAQDFADAATSVASTSFVTVDSLTIPQGAPGAGDLYLATFVATLLNSSGAVRTYSPEIRLGATSVLTGGTTFVLNSASTTSLLVQVMVAFVGTASQRLLARVDAGFLGAGSPGQWLSAAGQATSYVPQGIMSRVGVATEDSAAGDLALELRLKSDNAASTQTFTAKMASLRRLAAA